MIQLSKEQQFEFEKILMTGILKTLKDENLLSDRQLYSAILKVNQITLSELS